MGTFWMLLFALLIALLVAVVIMGVIVVNRLRRGDFDSTTPRSPAPGNRPGRLREPAAHPGNAGSVMTRDHGAPAQPGQRRPDERSLGHGEPSAPGTAHPNAAALERRDHDLHQRLLALDEREARLDLERGRLRSLSDELEAKAERLATQTASLEDSRRAISEELSRISAMTRDQARQELMDDVERSSRRIAAARARDIEESAQQDADRIARGIIMATIQRVATDQTSEAVVSTVDLPNDEMKGRVIGREGRNIRSFEQVTGVDVLVDDTPGSVLLSSFDPVRREIARLTMQELVADGRIHPARIEQAYERSRDRVREKCHDAAANAIMELGLVGIDPGFYQYIGALQFRTSYGQVVLDHLKECGRIAGAIAAEIGLPPESCKRAAFLHDVGKAVVTQGDGSHAAEGAELARRFGESEAVVNAIAAHHDEIAADSAEAVITQVADAISASRPGARRESMEAYVHRLSRLEQIAASHEGVDKVFAMQAGREVRVMVVPEVIDDAGSQRLAAEIAREVEAELNYPGNIRITVVRESTATELAH